MMNTEWSDASSELICRYVSGLLTSAEEQAVERRVLEDPEFAAALQLLGVEVADRPPLPTVDPSVNGIPDGKRIAGKGFWLGRRGPQLAVATLSAAVLVLCVSTWYFHADASNANRDKATLSADVAQLRVDNQNLLPAGKTLERASSLPIVVEAVYKAPTPGGALHMISFVKDTRDNDGISLGEVAVTFRGATFPCRFFWESNEKKGTANIRVGDDRTSISTGTVRLSCESFHGNFWYQPYSVVHNQKYLGVSLGTTMLTVKPGDSLHIQMEQPFAPWNATFVRIKGEWALVTLERPWANYEWEKYRAGQFGGNEKYPNTPMIWAEAGSTGLAKDLAAYFVNNRAKGGLFGRFRNRMHVSLIVPFVDGKVSSTFQKITQDELDEALLKAFELLRKQRPPIGQSVEEEIMQGAEFLETLRKEKR
jgi:hypothetical protein